MKENKNKGLVICIIVLAIIIIAGGFVFSYYLGKSSSSRKASGNGEISIEEQRYQKAVELRIQGMYEDAAGLFLENSTYGDSMEQYYQTLYEFGKKKMSEDAYEEANLLFSKISGYQDADQKAMECNYKIAIGYYRDGEYKKALALFKKLDGYENIEEYINKCNERIQKEKDYFRIEYVVEHSKEDDEGKYYTDGKGTLKFIPEQAVVKDDWVGFGEGEYVSDTREQTAIKFHIENKGKNVLKNPVIHVYFSDIWIKCYMEGLASGFEYDAYHVNGTIGYTGVVWKKKKEINAGASEDILLPLYGAYFCNGETGVMSIEVSADNYKKRVYKVNIALNKQSGRIVISKIEGNTLYYYKGAFISEIVPDPQWEGIVGYGGEKKIKISKKAAYYFMDFDFQSHYQVSKEEFMEKQKNNPCVLGNEGGMFYYSGMACDMKVEEDKCTGLYEEYQP